MNRGSEMDAKDRESGETGFNEAPIHESGKCVAELRLKEPFVEASMRPRFMNRGSTVKRTYSFDSRAASMRPRFMNRGSRPSGLRNSGVNDASMRPRFMNRGSHSGQTSQASSPWLQ